MVSWIIAGLLLAAIGCFGVYMGLMLVRAMREQFEELLPQRMIDFSGFVDVSASKD